MICKLPAALAVAMPLSLLALAAPGWAQDVPSHGTGPDRVCNVLIDSTGKPVMGAAGEGAVLTAHTYDCPEVEAQPIAQIAPAAPPPAPEPLPASGVIYFDLDKADLNPQAQASLASIIAEIKDRDLAGITVSGYTDTSGSAAYNMRLSQRRANTVATELIKAGVPARIISAEGFGQTNLAVPTDDGVVLQENRRVTIDFTP